MQRTKIKDLLVSTEIGIEVVLKGWVRTKRESKTVAFIAVNDGSIIHNIQVVVDLPNFEEGYLK
ncbi:MAG: asparagine--tRNA ligase, partial [Bacteroidota bacterium]|nr:asparagine--tRNA ligase [Bacteroidota bacterium]